MFQLCFGTPFCWEYKEKKTDEVYHDHLESGAKKYKNIYEHYRIEKHELKR